MHARAVHARAGLAGEQARAWLGGSPAALALPPCLSLCAASPPLPIACPPSLQELSRRCETLIRLIEKENEEDEERAGGKKRGPKPKAGGDSQAPSGAHGSSCSLLCRDSSGSLPAGRLWLRRGRWRGCGLCAAQAGSCCKGAVGRFAGGSLQWRWCWRGAPDRPALPLLAVAKRRAAASSLANLSTPQTHTAPPPPSLPPPRLQRAAAAAAAASARPTAPACPRPSAAKRSPHLEAPPSLTQHAAACVPWRRAEARAVPLLKSCLGLFDA